MVVTELPSRQILGLNQRTYQRLKLTLQLSLKRQLLIAICDDMSLRDRLVMQLETDVVATPATAAANLEGWQEHQYSLQRLGFDPKQPHLPKQIVTCLKQLQPLPAASKRVSLQITGIEQLTRQSATVQRQFLRSLRQIELLLPALEHSLLLWLPWPWARLIQQSVPGFWACHTGLFEFVGDPTPVGLVTDFSTAKSLRPTTTPVSQPSAAASLTASHTRRLVQPSSQKLTLMPPPAVPARKLKVPQKTDPAAAKVLPPPASSAPDSQRPDPQPLNPRSQQPPSPKNTLAQPRQPAASAAVALLPTKPAQTEAAQQADPAAGNAYLQLAQLYRDRLVAGDSDAELLAAAIQAYEEGLRWLPQHSPLWSDSLNDLGSLYWIKAQRTPVISAALPLMEKSVSAYEQALTATAVQTPEATGRLYSNLAAAHSFLANFREPLGHLKQAVDAYHHALRYRPAETAALEYSSLQNSLGAAHWRLAQHELPKQHLQQAVAAYGEARQHCQPHQEPLRYAMIENNLGVAYWSLAQHEQPIARLEQAIEAYETALVYRTHAVDAAACASTQNNLGTAYCELANHHKLRQKRLELWQKAIAAYTKTLQVMPSASSQSPTTQPLDPNSVHYSLGVIHGYLGVSGQLTEPEQSDHLAQALQHYLSALQGWQTAPEAKERALQAIANNLQLHHQQLGAAGQQQALQQIPAHLLPDLLPRL